MLVFVDEEGVLPDDFGRGAMEAIASNAALAAAARGARGATGAETTGMRADAA